MVKEFIYQNLKLKLMKNNCKNTNDNTKKSQKRNLMFGRIYECGRCNLISKEQKSHMIENNMINLVIKHIQLFDN